MSLPGLFRRLYAEAEQRGEAFASLQQGATVKVRAAGRKRQVILGRRGVPVGDGEEVTFRRDGRIPQGAERLAYEPTPAGWHYVAYTWEEEPGLFDDEPAVTPAAHVVQGASS